MGASATPDLGGAPPANPPPPSPHQHCWQRMRVAANSAVAACGTSPLTAANSVSATCGSSLFPPTLWGHAVFMPYATFAIRLTVSADRSVVQFLLTGPDGTSRFPNTLALLLNITNMLPGQHNPTETLHCLTCVISPLKFESKTGKKTARKGHFLMGSLPIKKEITPSPPTNGAMYLIDT